MRHGYGKFHSANNEVVYKGDWKCGLKDGNGVIEYCNGTVYEGEFKNGKKYGQGVLYFKSGNYHSGEWADDKRCGLGTMHWLNRNEVYEGYWDNDLQNGFGRHVWLENITDFKIFQNRYEGFWVNGAREGYGIFYSSNGLKYEGEWVQNYKEGFGIMTESSGEVIHGIFAKDRIQKRLNQKKPIQKVEYMDNFDGVAMQNSEAKKNRTVDFRTSVQSTNQKIGTGLFDDQSRLSKMPSINETPSMRQIISGSQVDDAGKIKIVTGSKQDAEKPLYRKTAFQTYDSGTPASQQKSFMARASIRGSSYDRIKKDNEVIKKTVENTPLDQLKVEDNPEYKELLERNSTVNPQNPYYNF